MPGRPEFGTRGRHVTGPVIEVAEQDPDLPLAHRQPGPVRSQGSTVTGADRLSWLNGLVTCELAKLELQEFT